MVRTLSSCGADVAVCYHRAEDRARELVSDAVDKGVRAIAVHTDVTVEESILEMRDQVKATLGDADIIVNNAVIQCYPWLSVLDQPISDYESQYRSCVVHNVLMARAFVPGMMTKDWGRVIAINSECAMQANPGQSAYVSGKRGMDGVLRVLAREVGEHQVTVNQIAPGWMVSDKYRVDGVVSQEEYERSVPLRRRGEDQDIANLVAFLASDLAGFISGQFISVSGGNVMPCI